MSIEQIWAVAISAIVTGIVTYLFSFIKEQKKKHDEDETNRKKILDYLIERDKEISNWAKKTDERLDKLTKTVTDVNENFNLMKHGGMSLLRDRIVQSCRNFIKRGEITIDARDNISDMYTWYSKMGGNGTGKKFYERAMQLPIDNTPAVSIALHMNGCEDDET